MMSERQNQIYDFIVLGAGLGGSLVARLLAAEGYHVVVVERRRFPRFAIGESSTPLADLMLRQMSERYGARDLYPLGAWGTWQRTYPGVRCGLKRGFSYFSHVEPSAEPRSRRLIVTASPSDEAADTHWLRSDTDTLLAELARASGVTFYQPAEVMQIERGRHWRVQLRQTMTLPGADSSTGSDDRRRNDFQEHEIHGRTVIDASGGGRLLARALGVADVTDSMQTRTVATFAHLSDLPSWSERFRRCDSTSGRYPFDPDHAAQHHLLPRGWLWMLRFNDGVTSVGWTRPCPGPADVTRAAQSQSLESRLGIAACPELCELFARSRLVAPADGLVGPARVQYLAGSFAGDGWFMLPGTAASLDPLHSTGIALTMLGVARILAVAAGTLDRRQYELLLRTEVEVLDALVALSYAAMRDFDLFTATTMLYFAAAIRSEETVQQNPAAGLESPMWLAGDPAFRAIVSEAEQRIAHFSARHGYGRRDVSRFTEWLRMAIEPWNRAGLLDPSVDGLYRYTAAAK